MVNLQLHFCGPAGATIDPGPGATTFQLEVSPSGHLVLPCSNFAAHQGHNPQLDQATLTLAATGSESQHDYNVRMARLRTQAPN